MSSLTKYSGNNEGLTSHTVDESNPHNVTKTQVDLGNVDNISDINKPISTAQQTALDLKQNIIIGKSLIDDTEIARLLNIEDNATRDQNGAEIASLLFAETDTNNYNDTEKAQVAQNVIDISNINTDIVETQITSSTTILSGDITDLYTITPSLSGDCYLELPLHTDIAGKEIKITVKGGVFDNDDADNNTVYLKDITLDGVVQDYQFYDKDDYINLVATASGYIKVSKSLGQNLFTSNKSFGSGDSEDVVFLGVCAGKNWDGWTSDTPTQCDLVLVGTHAGASQTGTGVVALGEDCAEFNTGNDSSFIGEDAGRHNIGNSVVCICRDAGWNNSGGNVILIGRTAGRNNEGSYSIGIGNGSISDNDGNYTIGIGRNMGKINTVEGMLFIGNADDAPTNEAEGITDALIVGQTIGSKYVQINGEAKLNDVSSMGTSDESLTTKSYVDTSKLKSIVFNMPINGVISDSFDFLGSHLEIDTNLTGDYSTAFSAKNQHVCFHINSLVGSGNVIITGTSVSESNAIPTTNDTESINIDSISHYQSTKKWLEITNIEISVGITSIDYDLLLIGYFDMGNKSWKIKGYRADMKTSGNSSSFALQLIKIQNDVNKVSSEYILEDYGHCSTVSNGHYFDKKRVSTDNRDYTLTSRLANTDEMLCYKMLDFDDYFDSNENEFNGNLDEGLLIHCEGRDSVGDVDGINQIDFLTLTIFYEII